MQRRTRPKNNNTRRNQFNRNQSLDSNGPDGKVRGTAQQIYEKYMTHARDATSAGEHVQAEAFFQFAEHYYRLASVGNQQENNNNRRRPEGREEVNGSDRNTTDSRDTAPPTLPMHIPIQDGSIVTHTENEEAQATAAKTSPPHNIHDTSHDDMPSALRRRGRPRKKPSEDNPDSANEEVPIV